MGLVELGLLDLAFRVIKEVIEIFIKDEEKKEAAKQQFSSLQEIIKKETEVA